MILSLFIDYMTVFLGNLKESSELISELIKATKYKKQRKKRYKWTYVQSRADSQTTDTENKPTVTKGEKEEG